MAVDVAPPPCSDGAPLPLPTVVVGGLGGSGTSLVAALLQAGGLGIGSDLNDSLDNLWATLLFKHGDLPRASGADVDARLALLAQAMLGGRPATPAQCDLLSALAAEDRPRHPRAWLQARAQRLVAACAEPARGTMAWGWKEPNAHMLLPHLARWHVRYVHVVRDGIAMAQSSNRNQHAYWAEALGCPPPEQTPRYALKFWCAVQQRAAHHAEAMGARFLMLDYDALCAAPLRGIARINAFLAGSGIRIPDAACGLVRPPPDRTGISPEAFDTDDLARALAWRERTWPMPEAALPDR